MNRVGQQLHSALAFTVTWLGCESPLDLCQWDAATTLDTFIGICEQLVEAWRMSQHQTIQVVLILNRDYRRDRFAIASDDHGRLAGCIDVEAKLVLDLGKRCNFHHSFFWLKRQLLLNHSQNLWLIPGIDGVQVFICMLVK